MYGEATLVEVGLEADASRALRRRGRRFSVVMNAPPSDYPKMRYNIYILGKFFRLS
jgi:hypothetical protein